ncbi:hypothetical protein J5Y04_30025 [Kitasatospora sp. RG8]|uniref:hypothetical protein n=1 Tax=Kitasatospora sp. RG8 TaxID=2820815 RepID=UPI001ADFDDD2|nr:hypothetical protein [Kitasatospora sp. RG8]MBP0453749.1 hypothetical protein [Kitasatospora sp. RG8]
MSSRHVLLAVVAAAAAVTLTACGPDNPEPATTAAGPTPANTAAPAPTGGATATGKPTGAAPATSAAATGKPSGGATAGAGQAGADCKPGEMKPVPAGHKVVVLTKATTATAVVAKDGEFTCQMPDRGWWPKGDDKTYTFAPGAKAALTTLDGQKPVSLAQLADHTTHCVNHVNDAASPCDPGTDYDLALDASGKITAITEVHTG